MKTKYYLFLFLLLTTVVFAQNPAPGDFGDPQDENPTDAPAAPIDSNLYILFGAAMCCGLYVLNKQKRKLF